MGRIPGNHTAAGEQLKSRHRAYQYRRVMPCVSEYQLAGNRVGYRHEESDEAVVGSVGVVALFRRVIFLARRSPSSKQHFDARCRLDISRDGHAFAGYVAHQHADAAVGNSR
jgi:hypothetical protein